MVLIQASYRSDLPFDWSLESAAGAAFTNAMVTAMMYMRKYMATLWNFCLNLEVEVEVVSVSVYQCQVCEPRMTDFPFSNV